MPKERDTPYLRKERDKEDDLQPTLRQQIEAAFQEVVKPCIENSTQHILSRITELTTQLHAVDTRVTTLEIRHNQHDSAIMSLRSDISAIRDEATAARSSASSALSEIEQARRFSYSFEVLIHGVPEDSGPEFDIAHSFFESKGLGHCLPMLEGSAYRLGKTKKTDRPRPVVVRLLSRAVKGELILKAGRKAVQDKSPYVSSHSTKQQLDEWRARVNMV